MAQVEKEVEPRVEAVKTQEVVTEPSPGREPGDAEGVATQLLEARTSGVYDEEGSEGGHSETTSPNEDSSEVRPNEEDGAKRREADMPEGAGGTEGGAIGQEALSEANKSAFAEQNLTSVGEMEAQVAGDVAGVRGEGIENDGSDIDSEEYATPTEDDGGLEGGVVDYRRDRVDISDEEEEGGEEPSKGMSQEADEKERMGGDRSESGEDRSEGGEDRSESREDRSEGGVEIGRGGRSQELSTEGDLSVEDSSQVDSLSGREEEEQHTEEEEENEEDLEGTDQDKKEPSEEPGWEEEKAEEEGKELEEEEEVNSPMFVPTMGKFFQHDTREGEDQGRPAQAPRLTREDQTDRWGHDMYQEEEQAPRQDWEKKRDARFWESRNQERGSEGGGGRRNRGHTLGSYMGGNRRDYRDRRPPRRSYPPSDEPQGAGRQGERRRGGERSRGKGGYDEREGQRKGRGESRDDGWQDRGRRDQRQGAEDSGEGDREGGGDQGADWGGEDGRQERVQGSDGGRSRRNHYGNDGEDQREENGGWGRDNRRRGNDGGEDQRGDRQRNRDGRGRYERRRGNDEWGGGRRGNDRDNRRYEERRHEGGGWGQDDHRRDKRDDGRGDSGWGEERGQNSGGWGGGSDDRRVRSRRENDDGWGQEEGGRGNNSGHDARERRREGWDSRRHDQGGEERDSGRWDREDRRHDTGGGRSRGGKQRNQEEEEEAWPTLPSGTSAADDWGVESGTTAPSVQWGPKKSAPSRQTVGAASDSVAAPGPGSKSHGPSSQKNRNSPPAQQQTPSTSQGAQNQSNPDPSSSKDPPPRTMFGSGASMVFSLSKERELVKSQERRSKARGRGRIPVRPPQVGGTKGSTTARYPAPKPGSGGITMIEPLEKSSDALASEASRLDNGENTGQFESVPMDPSEKHPGLPLRSGEDVARIEEILSKERKTRGGEELSPVAEEGLSSRQEGEAAVSVTPQGVSGGVSPQQKGGATAAQQESTSQPAASKPKRYSSQRQKTADPGKVPPTSSTDQSYQEMLAQQMKSLQLQQESLATVAAMTHGGVAGGAQELLNLQALVYQNPALLQQILWMNMQQQQQREQVAMPVHPAPMSSDQNPSRSTPVPEGMSYSGHIPHPTMGPPGANISLLGYPPSMPPQQPIPMTGPVMQPQDGYGSQGLYMPAFSPEQLMQQQAQQQRQQQRQQQHQQQRQQQGGHVQTIGKARSQAIPIVPPKE